MSCDILAVKNTFSLLQGSKHESRIFGEIQLFGGKMQPLLKHRDINFYRLFGGKKYVCTYTRFQTKESIFQREKVDFIKTPGYACLLTFWRGKIRFHLYSSPKTRIDFLTGFDFLAGKSRLYQNTGIKTSIDFLVGNQKFAHISAMLL